jgi:hypothetical protein
MHRAHSNYRVIQQETNSGACSEGHQEVSTAARVSLRRGGTSHSWTISPPRHFSLRYEIFLLLTTLHLTKYETGHGGIMLNGPLQKTKTLVHTITLHVSTVVLLLCRYSCYIVRGKRTVFLNRNVLPLQFLRREEFRFKNWLFLMLSENATST